MFTIKEIWRYPVKSMIGEKLETAQLTKNGIAFDRGWAIRDEKAQTVRGAKHIGDLMLFASRYLSQEPAPGLPVPHAEITFPDGKVMTTEDEGIHAALSEALGRTVTLWPIQPAANTEFYGINSLEHGDMLTEIRTIFALADDEPLDLSALNPNLLRKLSQFVAPPGTFFDAMPIDVLTEASLRYLKSLTPESVVDVRRFRPNILLADDQDLCAPVEEEWLGKSLRIGAVDISVVMRCPRCVMTTRVQEDIPADPQIMRTLVKHLNQCISVYGQIAVPGTISVGQEVVPDMAATREYEDQD